MEIVVINSFGPMGSSVVGAMVEKIGGLNIPVRKLGLHDYIMGNRSLSDNYILKRFSEVVNNHHVPIRQGGVSAVDRDASQPRQLINKDFISKDLSKLNKEKFDNIQDCYEHLRKLYAKAVVYKKSGNPVKHIEYTTDLIRFDPEALYSAYEKNFDKVHMIHLHRDFTDLMNAMASQSFISKSYIRKFKPFLIKKRYNLYKEYESIVSKIPGLHLSFKELFLPDTQKTIKKIADFLKMDMPSLDWGTEDYDLYGKLCSYNKAFTMIDDRQNYLSPMTKKLISSAVKKNVTIAHTVSVPFFYLMDSIRFQLTR